MIFPGSNVSSAVQCGVVPGPPNIWTKHSNDPIKSSGGDSKTPVALLRPSIFLHTYKI